MFCLFCFSFSVCGFFSFCLFCVFCFVLFCFCFVFCFSFIFVWGVWVCGCVFCFCFCSSFLLFYFFIFVFVLFCFVCLFVRLFCKIYYMYHCTQKNIVLSECQMIQLLDLFYFSTKQKYRHCSSENCTFLIAPGNRAYYGIYPK